MNKLAMIAATTALLTACGGVEGDAPLISTTTEAAGANCAAGGLRIDIGSDADDDGTLTGDEIDTTEYVCNGDDGTDGTDGEDGADGAACDSDADCGGALESCDAASATCRTTLTKVSEGTAEWPDQACNSTNSFGNCDTNASEHANAWATYVCRGNGWSAGVWTSFKLAGCSNTDVEGDPSLSMYCAGGIPCVENVETDCQLDDQTVVELICLR